MRDPYYLCLLFPILVNGALLPSIATSKTKRALKCVNTIPRFELFQFGYDATVLDLFACPEVAGKKAQIFDYNDCDKGHRWRDPDSGHEYLQPNAFRVSDTYYTQHSVEVLEKFDEFLDQQDKYYAIDRALESGFMLNSEIAIAMESVFRNGNRVLYYDDYGEMYSYAVDDGQINTPFVENFKRAAMKLPEKYVGNERDYIDFLKMYGTHYFRKGTVGHRILRFETLNGTVTDEEVKNKQADQRRLELSTDETETCKSQANAVVKYSNIDPNYEQTFIGGNVDKTRSVHRWLKTVHDSPGLLKVSMSRISSLINDEDKERQYEIQTAINCYMLRAELDAKHRKLKAWLPTKLHKHKRDEHYIENTVEEYEAVIKNDNYESNTLDTANKKLDYSIWVYKDYIKQQQANSAIKLLNSYSLHLTAAVTVLTSLRLQFNC